MNNMVERMIVAVVLAISAALMLGYLLRGNPNKTYEFMSHQITSDGRNVRTIIITTTNGDKQKISCTEWER